jgi:hypothetical protein
MSWCVKDFEIFIAERPYISFVKDSVCLELNILPKNSRKIRGRFFEILGVVGMDRYGYPEGFLQFGCGADMIVMRVRKDDFSGFKLFFREDFTNFRHLRAGIDN